MKKVSILRVVNRCVSISIITIQRCRPAQKLFVDGYLNTKKEDEGLECAMK